MHKLDTVLEIKRTQGEYRGLLIALGEYIGRSIRQGEYIGR